MLLEGKTAIITGGGSGIGRAAALRFAEEGARVAVGDIDDKAGRETQRLVEDADGSTIFVPTDVSKAADAERLVREAVSAFGALHVLVSNAGVFSRDDGPVTTIDEAVFDRVLDVNLRGMFLCCKYAFPEIVKSGGGAAVLTSSTGATIGSPTTAYGTSKGGVLGLMRSLAMQYAAKGIRVNAILPGPIDTPLLKAAVATRGPSNTRTRGMLGRMADPSEPAALIAFLASEEASYITGQGLFVDGGLDAS